MSTLPALGLAPLSGIIAASTLGVFLDWLLLAVFAVTLGSLLPTILASTRNQARQRNERRLRRAMV